MGETLKNLEDVYAKWHKKSQPNAASAKACRTNGYEQMIETGRQAWRDRFRDGAPRPPNRQLRQKRRSRHDNNYRPMPLNSSADQLSFFKTAPTIQPNDSSRRPYMGRCPSFLPRSRMMFFEEGMKDEGLKDILRLETCQMDQPWLTRTFNKFVYQKRTHVNFNYPDVSMSVLTSPRLLEAIQSSALADLSAIDEHDVDRKQLSKRMKHHEKHARAIVTKMMTKLSNNVVRLTGWFLHHLLGRLLSGILVHKGQITLLKKAHKKNIPILYLPTHRSHLDYILMTFLLWNCQIKSPFVAAGDNLIIPFFGPLLRRLGAFYIRRRLDSGNGKKDLVYRAALQQYIDELMQRGESCEFYIEGGRTRSGKALYPKGGLLSVVVDSYIEGHTDDVYIVPVGISYEKLIEGNFTQEQMGGEKKGESFFGAMRAIWKVVQHGFGTVRVDFGQPFSLKEYLEVASTFCNTGVYESHWVHGAAPLTPKLGSFSPLCSSDSLAEDHRYKIQGLAELIIHGCQNWQAIMSTHLLAFLLLTRHRQGIDMKSLTVTMEWLKEEVQLRGRDVGFCGKMEDVISHAANLLGTHLINISETKEGNEVKRVLTPATDLPNVFELSYYANTVSCTFALESVIAFAVVSETKCDDWLKFGHEEQVFVSKTQVLQKAADLCHLLQYEFIFKLPSSSWDLALTEAVEKLLSCEILTSEEDVNPEEKQFAARVSKNLSWSDGSEDSEDDFQIDNTRYLVNTESSYSMDKLQFLLSVIAPILECYYVVACHTETLINNPMQEVEFIKTVHKAIKDRVKSGSADYSESASYDSVRNAVNSFQQVHIIEKLDGVSASNKRLLMLHDDQLTRDRLDMLLETLAACVTLPNQCRF